MTHKALLVAGLLGTLLLSGCTFPGTAPCYHMGAVWEEDGIWAAFPGPGEATGWTLQRPPMPDGLPFTHEGLDAPWGANHSLTQVSWQIDAGGLRSTFSLWPGGLIESVLPDSLHAEDVRDLFHHFARALVDANETQMGTWANGFVVNADRHGDQARGNDTYRMMRHSVVVHAPYTLEAHYDDLGLAPTDAAFDTTLRADSWRYHFSLPEQHAAREMRDGEMHRITVNVLDGVHASVVADTADPEVARAAIRDGLQSLGIDAPGPDIEHFHPSAVC